MDTNYCFPEGEPAITAIGRAVPKYRQNQARTYECIIERFALNKVQQRILKTIYREAGVEYRHSVLKDFNTINDDINFFPNNSVDEFPSTEKRMKIYKENALNLALEAVADCFSGVREFNKDEITHLITVSCTGMSAPGLDIQLVEKLGLSKATQRAAINFMGCYGLFNGMRMAHAICKGDKKAKVLVVSVEICSIHFQNNFSLDNLISSTIFSDGAGAVLIESSTQKKGLCFCDFYCDIVPDSNNEMTWEIGDQGFDIRLSSYVPHLIERGIGAFVEKLLSRNHFFLNAIDYFAIHPGAKKILEGCEHALKITKEDNRFSYEVLRDFGNMSSATIAFVLKKIWDVLKKEDHKKNIFSCAFGPGLTLESMILEVQYV